MILLHKIRLTNSTEASVSRSAKEKKSNAKTFIGRRLVRFGYLSERPKLFEYLCEVNKFPNTYTLEHALSHGTGTFELT